MICAIGWHGWNYLQVNDSRFYSQGRYCWRCGRAQLMDREDGYFTDRPGLNGKLPEFIEELNSDKPRSFKKVAAFWHDPKPKQKPTLKVVR